MPQKVKFLRLAEVFDMLEQASSSAQMILLLAEFFATVSPDDKPAERATTEQDIYNLYKSARR